MAAGENKQQAAGREKSFLSSREDLEHLFALSEDEKKWFTPDPQSSQKNQQKGEKPLEKSFGDPPATSLKLLVPRYYADLIDPEAGEEDPIRKQCIPRDQEYRIFPWETDDPLGEDRYQVSPRLICRYTSRALFLAADSCYMYCRHCFRRRFAGKTSGPASNTDIRKAALWLKTHKKVKELLISGGDPFTLPPKHLIHMLRTFRTERPDIVLRIGTRIPVVSPELFNLDVIDELASLKGASLKGSSLKGKAVNQTSAQLSPPIYIITQFNHPRELTEESLRAVSYCIDRGIPVLNQTVLLRGVNDNSDVLEELMNRLVYGRIIPYYLFQGDMTAGTAHFRVPLETGYAIEEDLRRRLSGLAMPQFAVDLPGGGGKVPLTGSRYVRENSREYVFRNYEGETCTYPKDLP
ncbi:MAG: KamA family radical SAM protein [Spirochaetales bacterium]|nr:KamA family radical SAM protein [Spirochaetales bacterium]